MQAWWADHLALLAALQVRHRAAALLSGYADAVYARSDDTREVNETRSVERALAIARDALGAVEVERLRAQGALLRDADVDALAFAGEDVP